MFDKLLLLILFGLMISCSGPSNMNRLGTGKPKFSSLEIEGISCFMSSENGEYDRGRPLKLILKVKNISSEVKTYTAEKNKFLILAVSNEFSENIVSTDIMADRYFGGGILRLDPGEEKTFEIIVDTSAEDFAKANSINCRLRFYFLPKQFRRNAVSIFVEKK